MSREAFVAHARSMIGTPWRHRGRKPWGVDCVGLIVLSAQAAGFPMQDARHYGREPWDDQLRKELRYYAGEPLSGAWEPGDVVLIRWGKGEPSHVGILGDYAHGGLSLIHAQNVYGVVEHSLSGYFLDCVEEAYRLWPVKSSQ